MKKTIAIILILSAIATQFTGCILSRNEQVPSVTPVATISETIVCDNNDVKITVTGLDNDSVFGKEIKLLAENKTDRNIAISGDHFIVNGITVYGTMYINVAAGKKANNSISFSQDALDAAGIEEIATIKTYDAHIVDTDTFETLSNISFVIETSVAETYNQTINDSGDIIFNQNNVTVVAQVATDEFYGEAIRLLVKNNTGKDIIIEADNISVNGYTVSGWMYDIICKDTVRFCDLDIFSTSLEENGIEQIEDVSFTLKIIEDNTYDHIAESGELTISIAN